jgi:hypothetical protein
VREEAVEGGDLSIAELLPAELRMEDPDVAVIQKAALADDPVAVRPEDVDLGVWT